MAEYKIGTIHVITDFGGWVTDDEIIGYYNTGSKKVTVKKNGSTITSGPVLTVLVDEELNSFGKEFTFSEDWTRSDVGHITLRSGKYYRYPRINSYPYWIEKVSENQTYISENVEEEEDEVNDLEISLASIDLSSGIGQADGGFTLTVSGSNTPITYHLGSPNKQGQSSTSFTGLLPGLYSVHAKDSKKYTRALKFRIGIDNTPEDTISFGIRWRMYFKDPNGDDYQVQIKRRNYSGSIDDIEGITPAAVRSLRAEGSDIYEMGIIPQTLTLSLKTATFDQFKDIAVSDEQKYLVKLLKKIGGTYQSQWKGYAQPETFSDVPGSGKNYLTTFSATDRLGDLDKLYFIRNDELLKQEKFQDNQFIRGRNTQLAAFVICLGKFNLNQGFRIACNIFDATQSDTNNTPLNQTLFNADVYINTENASVATCRDVLGDILNLYNAILLSWEGHWYIIRQKELLNTTINYVEYDKNGAYLTTGSWNPKVDFKAPDQPQKFRWINGMSRTFTRVFKKAVIKVNQIKNETGLFPKFDAKTAVFDSDGKFSGFDGFSLKTNNESVIHGIRRNDLRSGDYSWSISLSKQENSKTYILWNRRLKYNQIDRFRLNIPFDLTLLGLSINQLPPYIIFKWSVRVGNKYLADDDTWSTTKTLNEFFVTDFNKKSSIDREFSFPPGSGTKGVQVKLYACSLWERHQEYGSESLLISGIKAIDVSSLSIGTRRIAIVTGSDDEYYYYELITSGEVNDAANIIRPTSFTGKLWRLTHQKTYTTGAPLIHTRTVFDDIEYQFLPGGEEAPESLEIFGRNNSSNQIDNEMELNLFDLSNKINNDEKLYLNYLQYTDGTPTGKWTATGGTITKKLQHHVKRWIQRLSKEARLIITGSFKTDYQFTPVNVLRDPTDDNRVFFPNGVTMNDKSLIHSGTLVEIGADSDPRRSAFTSGFKQNSVE